MFVFEGAVETWEKDHRRKESIKTSEEVEEIQILFEEGVISEEEVMERVSALNDRMEYLYKKGSFEQRNLFDIFVQNL